MFKQNTDMEKEKMDIIQSKREHRYKEIRELIGQLTLIEKYIRIRLCNGTLHKDEGALHILLEQHRDALYELGMQLNSLKILDSEEEEEYAEDNQCDGCVDCDMRAEDDDVRIAKNRRAEDDEDCKTINRAKDVDEDEDEYDVAEPTLITKDVLSALHFSYHPTQHYCEKDFGDVNVHIQLACGGGVEYCHIKRKYDAIVWTWEHDEILLTNIQYVHQLQQALELIGADCGDTF